MIDFDIASYMLPQRRLGNQPGLPRLRRSPGVADESTVLAGRSLQNQPALAAFVISVAAAMSQRKLALTLDGTFKEAGLDSIGLVNLTTRLEDIFDIEFDADDLTEARIGSPTALAQLLVEKYGVVQVPERAD